MAGSAGSADEPGYSADSQYVVPPATKGRDHTSPAPAIWGVPPGPLLRLFRSSWPVTFDPSAVKPPARTSSESTLPVLPVGWASPDLSVKLVQAGEARVGAGVAGGTIAA